MNDYKTQNYIQKENSRNLESSLSRRSFVVATLSTILLGFLPLSLKKPLESKKDEWDPGAKIILTPGTPFDLSITLPKNIKRGGKFEVDPHAGQFLQKGISLSDNGILFAEANFDQDISQVVFCYKVPA